MDHRVARGVSRIRHRKFAVTVEQWLSERLEDTRPLAWSNPRDHLRLVRPTSEPTLDTDYVLARLKAENQVLRNRAVDLALSIQALRQRAQHQPAAD